MSFGKINKIIRFIEKYIKNNSLEKIEYSDYYSIIKKILNEGKMQYPDLSLKLVDDIMKKRYGITYITKELTFDNGTTYYTIDSIASQLSGGRATINLTSNITTTISSGTTAKFYQNSRIVASGHTFEYCGYGIDPATSLPQLGGQFITGNAETVTSGGGQIFFTSTDQKGNFKIGPNLVINQASGTISGTAFNKSLFAIMTPYILALEG
jgi:hypothetical protein